MLTERLVVRLTFYLFPLIFISLRSSVKTERRRYPALLLDTCLPPPIIIDSERSNSMSRIVLAFLIVWAHAAAVAAGEEELLRRPSLRGGNGNPNSVSLPTAERHLETVCVEQELIDDNA